MTHKTKTILRNKNQIALKAEKKIQKKRKKFKSQFKKKSKRKNQSTSLSKFNKKELKNKE